MSTNHNISTIVAHVAYLKSQHDLKQSDMKNLMEEIESISKKTKKIEERFHQLEKKSLSTEIKQNEAIAERERLNSSNGYLSQIELDLRKQIQEANIKNTELENRCSSSIDKNERQILERRKKLAMDPLIIETTRDEMEEACVSKANEKCRQEIEGIENELTQLYISKEKETKEKIILLLCHAKTENNLENLPLLIEEFHGRMSTLQKNDGNGKNSEMDSFYAHSSLPGPATPCVDVNDLVQLFSFKRPPPPTPTKKKSPRRPETISPPIRYRDWKEFPSQHPSRASSLKHSGKTSAADIPGRSKSQSPWNKDKEHKSQNFANSKEKKEKSDHRGKKITHLASAGVDQKTNERKCANVSQPEPMETVEQRPIQQTRLGHSNATPRRQPTELAAKGKQNTPPSSVVAELRNLTIPSTPRPSAKSAKRSLFPTSDNSAASASSQSAVAQERNSQDHGQGQVRQMMSSQSAPPQSATAQRSNSQGHGEIQVRQQMNSQSAPPQKRNSQGHGEIQVRQQMNSQSAPPQSTTAQKRNSQGHRESQVRQQINSQSAQVRNLSTREEPRDSANTYHFDEENSDGQERQASATDNGAKTFHFQQRNASLSPSPLKKLRLDSPIANDNQAEVATPDHTRHIDGTFYQDQNVEQDHMDQTGDEQDDSIQQYDGDEYRNQSFVFSPFNQQGEEAGFPQDRDGEEEEQSPYFNREDQQIADDENAPHSAYSTYETDGSVMSDDEYNISLFSDAEGSEGMNDSGFLRNSQHGEVSPAPDFFDFNPDNSPGNMFNFNF